MGNFSSLFGCFTNGLTQHQHKLDQTLSEPDLKITNWMLVANYKEHTRATANKAINLLVPAKEKSLLAS
jgi:hypothetical protein